MRLTTSPRLPARLRRAALASLAALFLTTSAGCFGSFRLWSAVHDFNRSVGNPVVESLVMWGMILIPIYEVAFLADALVLNVVEYFNGRPAVTRDQTLPDGSTVQVAKVAPDTVRVRHVDGAGRVSAFDVVRVGADAGYLRRPDGRILGMVERLPDGRLVRTTP